jgi:NAD(P)-dependent dehydrogenase (short-subunit alcohol dehydrogenase family)
MMDLEFGGSVAVVTGASKGIGLEVVRALAAQGATVTAGALTVDSLADLDGVDALEVDLAQPGGPESLVDHAVDRHGRIDLLVNNVGRVHLRLDGFLETTDADFEASLQINFFAALRATRAAVAAMLPQGAGTIVNVVSVNALFHPDGLFIDYRAAKAALLDVAKALSQELGPNCIRINSVSPGPVETDLWVGDHGVAATIGRAKGVDPATVREQTMAGIASGGDGADACASNQQRGSGPSDLAAALLPVVRSRSPRAASQLGRHVREPCRSRAFDVP